VTRFALFSLLLATACSQSPYERGLELGKQHAELLRDHELTFERFTADLDAADDRYDDQQDRDELRRGYEEAIEPVRTELTRMIAEELTGDAIDQIGATARGLVDGIKRKISTSDGKLDREKVRALGRDVGKLLRRFEEGAKEFGKGVEEGLEEGTDAR
jgi:hypothetical protein